MDTTEAENSVQMIMHHNVNWEDYLTPAPLSIALMAELVFISSSTDFSINKPPLGGFKYINYPDSFRACLMQVCNSGWQAFNLAHNNMDQICLHTFSIPDIMKQVLKILFLKNDEAVKVMLPNQLKSIRCIANECVTLATDVEKKYGDVINLIHELLEACTNAKLMYGEELKKTETKIKEYKLREESAKELKERSKLVTESISKQLEEAQEQYKKAMDSLPSGWDLIGMKIVEALIDGIQMITNSVNAKLSTTENDRSPTDKDIKSEVDNEISEITIFSKSGVIHTISQEINEFISKDGIDWTKLYDQQKKCANTGWIEGQFKRICEELEKLPEGSERKTALSLCKSGLTICAELATYAPDQKCDEKTTKQLIKDIQKLCEEASAFEAKGKSKCGFPQLNPPNEHKDLGDSKKKSSSEEAVENAHFKLEKSQEHLKQLRESYEKSVENMNQNQKDLTNIMVELQNCDIKQIDFNTTVKMLVKGLDAMGSVKVQWEKMVQFFQMVANIVKISLNNVLCDFAITAEETQKLPKSIKLFNMECLIKQAKKASQVASLVHMISGTYCEVSNKYLMDRVSSLSELMAMDTEKPKFMAVWGQLKESCKEAQDGILKLVLKNKDEFQTYFKAEMAQIEGELKAIEQAAQPEETK